MLAALLALGLATVPNESPAQFDHRMQWFRDAKFGMFIHWGPVTLKGTEIGWSRTSQVPTAEYDALYKAWNPVDFDADAWMKLAKGAGMKYVVPTARHHDGFCLWPSSASDYTVAQTPFKRDVMGEIATAAKRQGLTMCTYYSILDWHSPDYPVGEAPGGGPKTAPDMTRFNGYLRAQLKELIDRYKVKLIWFDGQWEAPWTIEEGQALERDLRAMSPGIILNNRVSPDSATAGDYDTPEQKIGEYQTTRPWETCMTLGTQWAWKPNDAIKSFPECISILAQTVCGDGNLLLNVGPNSMGDIEPAQQERLRGIGVWLRRYGESIYGTRGGPVRSGKWGGTTHRGKTVYVHWLPTGPNELRLNGLPEVSGARVLTGGKAVVERDGDETALSLASGHRDPVDTIVKLTVR